MMTNLLFIPGLLCDETLWQPVLQAFKNTYDSQIVDIASCEVIEELSQALCQHVNKDIVLVGFSLGAWIALSMCTILPKYCKALILISSAPGSLTTTTRQHFLTYIQQIAAGNFEEFIEADFKQDVSAANQNNPNFKKSLMDMMRRQGPEVAIRQLNAMLKFKGNFDLSHVHCPTLLIRGVDDKSVNSKRQEQMLQEIQQAELAIVPNSAHYVPLENPKMTALTIENWLNAQSI
jgi:pimeloyl-ACP methyl ester carboxylesterase